MADDKSKKVERKLVPDRKADKDGGALTMALRVALGTAGLCLVVGFFLPWLKLSMLQAGGITDLGGSESISGLAIAVSNNPTIAAAVGNTRWILLFVPVLGLGLTAVGFLGLRWSGAVGAGVGVLLIGYGVFTLVYLFFQVTAPGLWVVLAGSFVALSVGVVTIVRARRDKPAAPDDEPSPASPPPEKSAEAA